MLPSIDAFQVYNELIDRLRTPNTQPLEFDDMMQRLRSIAKQLSPSQVETIVSKVRRVYPIEQSDKVAALFAPTIEKTGLQKPIQQEKAKLQLPIQKEEANLQKPTKEERAKILGPRIRSEEEIAFWDDLGQIDRHLNDAAKLFSQGHPFTIDFKEDIYERLAKHKSILGKMFNSKRFLEDPKPLQEINDTLSKIRRMFGQEKANKINELFR